MSESATPLLDFGKGNEGSFGPENVSAPSLSVLPQVQPGVFSAMAPNEEQIIIPIASGKGGVGKTNFAVNLALALARAYAPGEKTVTLMDGDLGLPNADLIMGIRTQKNLEHFLRKEAASLDEIMEETPYANLQFIGGGSGASLGMANLYYQQKQKFLESILRIKTDYLILDLGASNSYLVLDFFMLVNSGLVVLTPEPTSIRDAYHLIKSMVIRRLRREFGRDALAGSLMDRLEDPNDGHLVTMDDLLHALEAEGEEGIKRSEQVQAVLRPLRPRLVVNRAASLSEAMDVARRVGNAARRHLGIETGYMGPVLDDANVGTAVRERIPFVERFPNSRAAQSIEAIKRRLLDNEEFTAESNLTSFFGAYLSKFWRH